jgi:hypothetical protein
MQAEDSLSAGASSSCPLSSAALFTLIEAVDTNALAKVRVYERIMYIASRKPVYLPSLHDVCRMLLMRAPL